MTTICITDVYEGEDFSIGSTLADVAQKATEDRAGKVTAIDVTPIGGTHCHIIYRDVDPEDFWLAQLAHTMSDNENFGWGETEKEAKEHACA